MSKSTIFISHITQEKEIAYAIKNLLEDKFLGTISVFVSSHEESLPMGDDWISTIKKSMIDCHLLIVICSPISIVRPWINFEAGAGWIKGIPVIPLCHSGLTPDKLPVPINSFQGGTLNRKEDITRLFNRIASLFNMKAPKLDDDNFFNTINSFEHIVERNAIHQDTLFINNLLYKQIVFLRYSIFASTFDYEELKNLDFVAQNIDYNISFNKIHNLFNVSLLMISTKRIYEFFYENANRLADNCKFILSYNNIQIVPDLKSVLNQIIFLVSTLDNWFENIARINIESNIEIKKFCLESIKSATPPFELKGGNIIDSFIYYYESLLLFQTLIINYETIIGNILNQPKE
ncbi:MAG: toll/interleukin-1 receptor domain-containing protein [Methylococcaceae bacterium]